MTKRFAFVLCIAVLGLTLAARAKSAPLNESLFFSVADMEKIGQAVDSSHHFFQDKNVIALGAILYFGPKQWTVWLKGEKWTPDTRKTDLLIKDVQEDRVTLVFSPPEGGETVEITLHPHQSYHIASGEISAGGS